ncbi:MAG: glycoside hydrolase family 43 protein [Thermoleophilia bacterium]|nr:glycoside hydrolase family 43 protein [Thermoleophilia bacterium]
MIEQRPIIPGFHPDPSICRAGDGYYLVCSSFEYSPGVPIFRSRDLRKWEQIGHVLDRPSQLDLSRAGPSGGVFAPTLRHHGGRFWMITTNVSDGGGQLLVWADDPAGPWSEPVRVRDGTDGIDPDLAWDGDRCLMTWAGRAGITQAEIDPITGSLKSDPALVSRGAGWRFPEGPHLYRRGGLWYLMIAEGGTEGGHSATIARGPSPSGPFELCPRNPILTHRGLDLPVQNTGHADLVEAADGSWAIVYLGIRAKGMSPQFHVLGRETFAQRVEWVDDWPVLTECIVPDAEGPVARVDDFHNRELGLEWVSPGRPPQEIARLDDPPGCLTISARDDRLAFAGRRQEHLCCSVWALVDASAGRGGLSLYIDPAHHYDLELSARQLKAVAQIGPLRQTLAETADPPRSSAGAVALRVDVRLPDVGPWEAVGPDEVSLGYEDGGGSFIELARLDGRYVSTEVAGGMTGRLFGLFASTGVVRVDRFEYRGSDEGRLGI